MPSKTPVSGVTTLRRYLPFGRPPAGTRGKPISGGVPANFSGAQRVRTASHGTTIFAVPFAAIDTRAMLGFAGSGRFTPFGGGGGFPAGRSTRLLLFASYASITKRGSGSTRKSSSTDDG